MRFLFHVTCPEVITSGQQQSPHLADTHPAPAGASSAMPIATQRVCKRGCTVIADLLPSGLYRRPRILTEVCLAARGARVDLPPSPPVRNYTLPRRSLTGGSITPRQPLVKLRSAAER